MGRSFWRETRRTAVVLLLLFLASGATLMLGRAVDSYNPLAPSVMVANQLQKNAYYAQHGVKNDIPDDMEILQECVQAFAEEGIYLSLILYEEDADTVRAASGNYLRLWPSEDTLQEELDVALDFVQEEESLRELLTCISQYPCRLVRITGYRQGHMLYPVQLTLEVDGRQRNWRTLKQETVTEVKRFAFSAPEWLEGAEPVELSGDLQYDFLGNQGFDTIRAASSRAFKHTVRSFQKTFHMAQEEHQKYRAGELADFAQDGVSWSDNKIQNEDRLLDCFWLPAQDQTALYLSVNMVSYPLYDALQEHGWELMPLFFFHLCVFIALLTRKFWAVSRAQGRAAQRQRDFTNALAHEMKTPLGVIRGYSELMQEGVAPAKHPVYLAGIVSETERMDGMVGEMLSYSRLDMERQSMQPTCFAIDGLLRRLLEEYRPLLEQKQLALYVDVPDYLYVTADEKGIALVLRNFLSNAVKYAPQGKAVRLHVCRVKRRVLVEVFNEGEPIAAKDLPYVWDAFYRADEARTRENGGSGMGLAIAKAVLERHNARYGVYNRAGGICFWCSLAE